MTSKQITTTGTTACVGEVGPLPVGWWDNGGLVYSIDGTHYSPDDEEFPEKVILLGQMTSPEIFAVINRIAGIVTEQGGITCHAAIVSREMNIPTIVGCGFDSLFTRLGFPGEVSIKATLGGGTLIWHEVGKS